MSARSYASDADLAKTAAAMEAAWPGVRVLKLHCRLDNRRPDGIGGSEWADVLTVDLRMSAEHAALVDNGLVSLADLESVPVGRQRQIGSTHVVIHRGVRRARVDACFFDPVPSHLDARTPAGWRLWDCMAAVIARAAWSPRSAQDA